MKSIIKWIDKHILNNRLREWNLKRTARRPNLYNPNYYRTNQDYPYRGYEAMRALLNSFDFNSVLDIGCGEGVHSNIFLNAGKKVTAIDYGESEYFKKNNQNPNIEFVIADINDWDPEKVFDCIWCSHVLEHQLNVNIFLKKLYSLLPENGILAISVPPLKQEMVGGHVSLWTPGLLLYNLILAGFNTRDAMLKVYDKDISVILRKQAIELPPITYDIGDIMRLRSFFPKDIEYWTQMENERVVEYHFNGNIEMINWRE